MPELPEVETVCRGLSKKLTGAHIISLEARRKDLRAPLPTKLTERLKGRQVIKIERRAKYILIRLNEEETLVIHLGMSGRLVISQALSVPGKHDHLIFHFDNGLTVTFNDPRRFGLCTLLANKDLPHDKLFRHLGLEPLGSEFTSSVLKQKLRARKTAIKIVLMDQHVVVGVGNIYVAEALFYSGIRPTRPACSITTKETTLLVGALQKVLKAAIAAGGSSLRDYVQSDGELGNFQTQHAVYGREGKPCLNCVCDVTKTGGVKRITQGGRGSFYCAFKQK